MATEADVPEAISIAKEEGVDRSLTIEQLDRTVDQCSPVELNKPKGDLDQHPEVHLEKPFANGKNVQVEYSMEVESKNNSFGVSEGEHFLDPLSMISQGEQSTLKEVQLQKGTQVGGPVEETGSEDNEVIEERKEKFAEEENHDILIGAGIISEITKTADANIKVEEVETSINETGVRQVISNQQDSINEDVQCLKKEADISSIDIKGADMADGNDDSYQKEASDLLEATTFQEYEASISTHDVANSSFKKDNELGTNVTSNDEEDSQETLQNYEQKEELEKFPEVTLEDARTESNEVAEVYTCTEEGKTIQNAPEYAENEEANPVHCPKENDTVNEKVCEATSSEQETAEHALLEIHAAENHPQEFSEEKSRDYQPSVEAAHLSTDTVEENLEDEAIQEKSPSLVEEETTQQISREEVHSSPLVEEKEADAKCEDSIGVADTTREIEVETTEQRSETNKDIYVPIPKEEAYTDESTRTFVENNSFPAEVTEVKTKEIVQEDQPIVSDYGLVSGEVSQVSAEAENKEHVHNTPEEKSLQTIFTDETVVETEDHAEAGANFNSETTEKEIQAAEDEGETELKEINEDKEPVANANIAPDKGPAAIIPDQPALHTEDIELQSEENVNSKDKLEEQIPAAAEEGGNGLIEGQTENFNQVTDTNISAEEKDPETTLTNEKALDVKDFDVQANKAFISEENLEKQLPVVADEGKRCLNEAEKEKEQEALTTTVKGEPPLDTEVFDKQAEENFNPNEKLEELIPEGADECNTGLKEAKEEKEQVKITDDAPEEKDTFLTDERALGNDEIELQVEENASSINNLDEQIRITAEEGDAGLKEPDEDTIDSSPEKKGLVTILTDETTQVAEDTDVKAGDNINSNEIEGESCSTEPQEVNKEKVTCTNITPEEKIVNSQGKLKEQVPVVADEGNTGINETEEEYKEQIKSEDTTPEEKGLPIISTDDTALASEEIESQSEGNVSSTNSLEKQIPVAADEAEYGLTKAEKHTTEQSTITDITPEVKSVPMILTDQTALDSEKLELHEGENVKSMDHLEKQIPIAADVGEDIFTEAKAESNEQVATTDITPEEKSIATIQTDERSLETEHTNLQSVECANSIENLEEEILAAPELGETCLKQEDEVVNEEQVKSSDSSHEAVLATILTEETSQDIEYADVQAGENSSLEDILEKQIPTPVHEGETDLKEVEEDIKEQVETTEIAPEEKARGTILSNKTAEGVELINAQVEEINLKEVLDEQIPTASNAGETDLKEAEADIKEQVETTNIIPEQKGVDTILSDEKDLDLEDVHVQEKENFSLNENPTVDEGVTDLKKGEAETKEQVKSTYIAPEEKDVTTILRDEMAAEIQDDDVQAEEKPEEASEGEEKVGILNDIPVVDHNTELVEEATVEQSYQVPSHEEAEPKNAVVEDEKSEEHPERNHVIVEEVLDEPTITSRHYSKEQIIEPNVASCVPELIEDDTIKSSTETIELKEEGSCTEKTKAENASDLTREYTLEDASEQIQDKDYNAVKSGNENLEDLQTAEVHESTTCETKNVEPSEEILITSYEGVQQREGSRPAPTEKQNEEGRSIDYIVEDNANDISTEYVAEDIDDKLKECIEETAESKEQIIEGNVATSKPESIEEDTVKNSEDIEKVTVELREEGTCTESIKEENASELSPEYKENAFDSAEKILKDSQTSGDDESSTCETPSTLPVVQLLLQKQVQENIEEDTFSVQETKDDDNGAVTVTETIAEVPPNDEDGSLQVLQKSEQEEEVTTEQGEDSSPASTEALNQEKINEDTQSAEVAKDDGNYGAVNITETRAEVPSNDKEAPEVLQNYEPEEVIEKLPDLEHKETTPESSSNYAKDEIQESLVKEKDTKESETSSGEVLETTITEEIREIHPVEDIPETATKYQACVERAELSAEGEKENSEDQTTQEVSPSMIVETSEESSKEEEKSEGHFECQDSIEEAKSETLEDTTEIKPISEEVSNKTLVEDNPNSLPLTEKEVENEIKGENSSAVRSLDSEVVSDNQTSFTEATAEDNEQVETTQIAPEQKDNEGIDVYKTELVGETIREPSFQVQTLEEAATPKLDVEDETDKSVDLPEKNNKICEEVLEEPKITDRDFNVEQTTEGNVSDLTTEAIEEYDAVKNYQGEEKETEKLNEEGSCIETINEGNTNDISTESAPEDKDEKLKECIEEAFEEQITDRNVKSFSPESIEDDTVQNSQDSEKETIEVKKDGSCTENIKEENASELKEEYEEDASKSEEEIPVDSKTGGVDERTTCETVNVETSEETLSTLPVVQLLLQNQVQQNIDEDTFSVQQIKDGDDGAVTTNDKNDSLQLLQKYEPEEDLTNLRDVLPEETKIESSSENAEVVTCTKMETQKESDTSMGEASTEAAALSNEVEKEQQTTGEVSSPPIGEETIEESSKEEEKEEGHEECKEASEVPMEEISNKTLVEDGLISSDESEEVIEKEIQGEYSSTSRSLDSEVASDERSLMEAPEQVEATHIALEEDIGGTDDSYNTELVGQTIEPSSQVQTVEEEVEPKLEVEDENDKADDHPEKSDNICEKQVLDEPKITDRNFHEEQIMEIHDLEDKVSVAERTNEKTKEVEVPNLALQKLDSDAPEETIECSEAVIESDTICIDAVTEDEAIAAQTRDEEVSKEPSTLLCEETELRSSEHEPSTSHPEEKELVASEHEHETTSVERSTEDEIPKEVKVLADENKQELFAATPTNTYLQTEEPRDTESAMYKLDVGETEEEIEGTFKKVTRSDSQSVVMASRDEIIVDQILCEEISDAPLSKERELGASELALEKMAAVDTEEIKEGPEIVPTFDSGIIGVVSNDEITSDQTFDKEMLKEQIQSPSSTLLPEEKKHETFEPERDTIAQEKSTERECTKEVEVSDGESSQALLVERPVEEECSQKEEPSELNVSELSLGKIDAADTEEANTTFETVSTPDFPSIVADLKEITVDETLSKGVTDIPPEIPSYTSFHEEMEPKASELYLEKLDADIPEEEIKGSEVIPQLVSQSSCEVLKDETVADPLEIPSLALLPDEKELKAPEHEHRNVINEKNLEEVTRDEASEYVFVARSVDETCLQKEEPSKLEVPESALEKLEVNGAEEVKIETVSKSDSQSINAVPKDDSIANQTLSDVITDMPLGIPSYTSLPKENEEAKEDVTELPLEKLEADEPAEVRKSYEVTPKSDLQSFDVVVKDEIITDQVLHEGIAEDELLIQSSTLLPEEKELKETEHSHGTAPQDKILEDECAKETEVTAVRDLRDVVVPSSEEKTHLQKEEARELKVSELSPESEGECEGEKEIKATFEITDAVPKEETTVEQTLHQQEEQLQIASPTLLPKERDEATVHKEELEDCKVLELSLKGETEEETKEASETLPQVSSESIGELGTYEIVNQIPPSSLISEEKSCENITTINNTGEESMNVVRSPNDESGKDTNSAEEIRIPNEEPSELNVSDLEFSSSRYTERESSNEGKNLEVATFDLGADNSSETTVEANQTVKNEVQNEEIKDEKEVGKDSQLISVGEEYVRMSQHENKSREEEYPEETNDIFTAPNEYHHEVAEVDRTGRLSGDIEKQVIPGNKSFKDHNPNEAEGRIQEMAIHAGLENQGNEINCETKTVEVTYPGQKGSSVEISQGVLGVGEANVTTQDTKQLEKESHATNIPISKDDAQNFLQLLKSEDTKPSNDTLLVRDTEEEIFCGSTTETVDSTSAQCSLSERLMEESAKESVKVVAHLTEEKELQAHEEEDGEHENVEEAKTDEEKEDIVHKQAPQGYDEPVIVEASRESEVKVSPKKSHNILSGMGKSVKHSISKVKKAIIGKSSNSKTQSEK